jgi:hypothetical protein
VNCYSVSPHSFFYCFFQNCFSILFFNIELVDNYNCGFSHKTLWIATVFSHMFFFYEFFQKFICRFYFFNIELVENLALIFFSLKHCGLLRCVVTCFFSFFVCFLFCMIFFKIIFVDFIFLILS